MTSYPVFNAHRTIPVDLPNNPTSVSYDLVTINQGGGLNGATGVFVAPIKGVYYFSYIDTTLATSVYTAVKILKNGDVVATGYVHSGDRPWIVQPIFTKVTLMLKPGDQVSVQEFGIVGSNSANNQPIVRDKTTLAFTGFLLNAIND